VHLADRQGGAGNRVRFMILDLVRPRHFSTRRAMQRSSCRDAPSAFQVDTTNSLMAAYSHEEIKAAVDAVFGPGAVRSICSRVLPLLPGFLASQGGRGRNTPAGHRGRLSGTAVRSARASASRAALDPSRVPQVTGWIASEGAGTHWSGTPASSGRPSRGFRLPPRRL